MKSKAVFVYLHDATLLMGARSGPGAPVQEDWSAPVKKTIYADATDEQIGDVVKELFEYSVRKDLVDSKDIMQAHMKCIGAKTLKALYKNTTSVSCHCREGTIRITATRQNRLGGFESIAGQEVVLSESALSSEIGGAIKEMLSKSRTNF